MQAASRVFVIALAAGALSLFGTGCENSQKTSTEHPQGEHPSNGEHPQGEHPQGEHPAGEHPGG